MIISPRYKVVEELSRSDSCVMFRALRNLDEKPVLLKVPGNESSAGKESFNREFEILQNLSIDGFPPVIEFDDGILVLEDPGGNLLTESLGSNQPNIQTFLNIAIKLSSVLAEIHRHEIILNIISPERVLFNSETGKICFVDLAFATRNVTDSRFLQAPKLNETLLRYASPEQTRRMNRGIDYRTDLYSLGVVFYELLTGNLPFDSGDALELIHSLLAKAPTAPSEINLQIPEMVSQIVLKLLAKTAEARYQSALGLKADLEICAEEYAKTHRITTFALGQGDFSDKFTLPQALYGREQETEKLISVFDLVSDGSSVLMLVAGYSGIGKTSLIHQIQTSVTIKNGYFISGKFDQVARGTPFSALIQAFRGLVCQLLTESEEQLNYWRTTISGALGTNGGVLAEVIPEIELIIGKQAPPPALGATETLNRFQLVFQNFVGAIAKKDRPLVVFLDDLQWVDSATLSLLQPLLASSDVRHFLLIGAYRDNEVDNSHSLTRTLRGLESAGVEIHRLLLKSLQLADLTRFVNDTLHGEAESLAQLVWEKTGGNPFFVRQFLQMLRQEKLLKFNYEQRRWTYQIEDISRAGVTDNVIDLMTRKIQRLSARVQNVLMLASCIGNPFDEKTLAIVSEKRIEEVSDDLNEAIQEGLIIPISDRTEVEVYSFLHDRIQQAAHSLIPEGKKQAVHLTVGRMLSSEIEEKIFDVVNHLNLAKTLIEDESELLNLAQLNLNAGRKAKSSAAFEAALEYLKTGASLLTEKDWDSSYELAFELFLETAECEYLCGNFDEVEMRTETLIKLAKTNLDKAKVFNLRMLQFENLTRYADSIAAARESLALFDVSFPDSAEEKQAALEIEIETIENLRFEPPAVAGGLTAETEKIPDVSESKVQPPATADGSDKSIASLIDLPTMTDAETRMVMNILTDIWSAVYITGDAVLARLISATMVKLSLLHGNTAESAYGYVTHAITVGPILGNYEAAYEFGELALNVNERFNDLRRRAKIHQQFHAHVALWRKPFQICVEHAQEACRSGLEAGDFLYAAYGAATETWTAHLIGNDLEQFVQDYLPSLALIRKLKVTSFADSHNLMLHWGRALQGKTAAPTSFSSEEFDENEYIETYRDNPFFTMFHAIMKMQLCYLFDENEQALEAAAKAGKIAHQLEGMIWTTIFDFWNGLILLSQVPSPKSQDGHVSRVGTWDLGLGSKAVAEIEAAQKSLAILAENCPENFLCQSLLLSAEIERVKGQEILAIELYERAIAYAVETNSIRHQALANELYGKFWLRRGQEKIAAAFISEACRYYADWGAFAKVEHLQSKYSELFESQKSLLSKKSSDFDSGELDIFSVTKAAQAITGEVEFEQLLTKLIRITIENAGAQRGSLILERDGEMLVFAEDSLGSTDVKLRDAIPLSEANNLPLSVINFAQRTLENVVLTDAKNDQKYGKDAYILQCQPSSVMCVPIINQGRLRGLLYLENNAVSSAFTADRIKICQILASQAAISLENVQLYGEMRQEAEQRRKAEETLRSVMEGTAGETGDNFFASMVKHLADTLGVRYAFVTECRDYLQLREKAKAKMVAFWQGDRLSENVSYELGETPCLNVFEGQTCYYPSGVQQLFPMDKDLVALNADGYLGIPLYASTGQVVGHLAVLDDKPLVHTAQGESLLRIFAARAGAELERLHAEEELRVALAEVEQLKNQLHEENIYLQEEIRQQHNFEEIIGDSPALIETLNKVERVAPTDATVLITGETGTGKELIARAIHNFSERKNRPLVKVNCGAISAGLVESELFGHAKGAFTGAVDKRAGRFELANGGTIFLDEVGELPMETQVKLLRVLQEGEFESVGSSKTVKVDVRIIAATNRNLEQEIEAGRFRSDLFYRLNVFPVRIPSLRERREDIPLLVMFFMQNFAKKFGRQIQNVPTDVMNQLTNYEWSGNVRELQNIIERGVVLASPDETSLRVEMIPFLQTRAESPEVFAAKASSSNIVTTNIGSPASALQDVERQHISAVLEKANWKIEGANGAAQVLNLHPNTLRSRLKKLNIQRPQK